MSDNPELGQFIDTCGYRTNVHDIGSGHPVMLLHGSGAGVSGWANWRGVIPHFSQKYRVIVPDLVGFGYTEIDDSYALRFMESWIEQMLALMDGLGIEKAHVVGNSFGGAVALWLAWRAPDRFDKLVLMGPGGVPIYVGPELSALWGYKPSLENMRNAMSVMAYNQNLITDDLIEMRYKATLRPGAQEAFERVFPPPHQRWLDAEALPIHALQAIKHDVLIIHGRDDRVVPLEASLMMHRYLENSQVHSIAKCGHWTMMEHPARFRQLVENHLDEVRV